MGVHEGHQAVALDPEGPGEAARDCSKLWGAARNREGTAVGLSFFQGATRGFAGSYGVVSSCRAPVFYDVSCFYWY